MGLIDNIHPQKNWITTIIAVVLFAIGCFMYAAPYICITVSQPWYVPLIVFGLALVCLFTPDQGAKEALGIAEKLTNKKNEDSK